MENTLIDGATFGEKALFVENLELARRSASLVAKVL